MEMNKLEFLSKLNWDVDRYQSQFNPNYWSLCRRFMLTHKSKYPEKKLVDLTHSFYQMGANGKKCDRKTTRMVAALATEMLDNAYCSDNNDDRVPTYNGYDFHTSLLLRESDPYINRQDYIRDGQNGRRSDENNEISSNECDFRMNNAGLSWRRGDSSYRQGNSVDRKEFRRGEKISSRKIYKDELISSIKRFEEMNYERRKGDESSEKNEENERLGNICDNNLPHEYLLNESNFYSNIAVAVLQQQKLRELFKEFVIFRGVNELSKPNDSLETLENSFKDSKFGPCEWDYIKLDKDCGIILVRLRWKDTVLAEAVGTDKEVLRSRLSKVVLGEIARFALFIEAKSSYYGNGEWVESTMKIMNNKVLIRSTTAFMRDEIDIFASMKSAFQGRELVLYDQSTEEKNELILYVTSKWGQHLRYRKAFLNNDNFVVCFYHDHQLEFLKQKLLERPIHIDISNKYMLHFPGCQCLMRISPQAVASSGEIVSAINENVKEKSDLSADGTQPHTRKDKVEETAVVDDIDLMKLLSGFILFHDATINSKIEENSFSDLMESFNKSKFGPLEVVNIDCGHWTRRCLLKCKGKILAEGEDLVDAQAQANATLVLLNRLKSFSFTIQANEEYFCNGHVPKFLENPGPYTTDEFRIVKFNEVPNLTEIVKEFCEKPTFGELIFGEDFPWEVKVQISRYSTEMKLNHRFFTSETSKKPTHMAVYQPVNLIELKDYLLHNKGPNYKYKLISPDQFPSLLPIPGRPDFTTLEAEMSPSTSGQRVDNKRKLEDVLDGDQKLVKKFRSAPADFICDYDLSAVVLFIGVKHNSKIQTNVMQILNESFLPSRYGRLHISFKEEDMGGGFMWTRCMLKVENPFKTLVEVVREDKLEAKNKAAELLFNYLRTTCYTVQAKKSYYREGEGLPMDCKTQQYLFMKEKKTIDYIVRCSFQSKPVKAGIELVFGREYSNKERKKILVECAKMGMGYRALRHENNSKIAVYRTAVPMTLKEALIRSGGENERYQLIEPGGEISFPGNEIYFPACETVSLPKPSYIKEEQPLITDSEKSKSENNIQIIKNPQPFSITSLPKEDMTNDNVTCTSSDFWGPNYLLPKVAKSLFMCKFVRRDSTTETDACALLESTISLIDNVYFKYFTLCLSAKQYQVVVGLMSSHKPLKLGAGVAGTALAAKIIAADKTVDLLQKYCKIILPNSDYFAEGGVPLFLIEPRAIPQKTAIYEIAAKNSIHLTFYSIIQTFLTNKLQDLFFLASDFSNSERNEIVNYASTCGLEWRLFGPVETACGRDDLVTTQHVCLYKKKTVLTLMKELVIQGGATEKYYIKKPEEYVPVASPVNRLEEDLEKSLRCLDDCHDYYNSTCIKKRPCPYRHEPKALKSRTVCFFWEKSQCFDIHCPNRHMKLRESSLNNFDITSKNNSAIEIDVSVPPPRFPKPAPLISYPVPPNLNKPPPILNRPPPILKHPPSVLLPVLQTNLSLPPPIYPLIPSPMPLINPNLSNRIPLFFPNPPIGPLGPKISMPPPTRLTANFPNSDLFAQRILPIPPANFRQRFSNLSDVQGVSSYELPFTKQNLSNSESVTQLSQSIVTKNTPCVVENQPGGCRRDCGLSHSNVLDAIVNEYLESH